MTANVLRAKDRFGIEDPGAHAIFGETKDGVVKVALRP